MADAIIQDKLDDLYRHAPAKTIDNSSKIIIFSDLHMGNGSSTDDFVRNAELFTTVIKKEFKDSGYTVVLNGDIEDLYRFRIRQIMKRWKHVYDIFENLLDDDRFIKIVGNHDYELYALPPHSYPFTLVPAFRFSFYENDLLAFHGHQATTYFDKWSGIGAFFLRYFANPLKIKNRTVAHNSVKKFKTELRIYEFSMRHKIITLMGHTHRPLFQSHSKIDEVRFKIENHLRSYESADEDERKTIEQEVSDYKQELTKLYESEGTGSLSSALYNQLVVPSLFNSGCVIGKRGITGIEIVDGKINLIHWFDHSVSVQHLSDGESTPQRIEGTSFYRTVLQSESLAYIFARIKLLA